MRIELFCEPASPLVVFFELLIHSLDDFSALSRSYTRSRCFHRFDNSCKVPRASCQANALPRAFLCMTRALHQLRFGPQPADSQALPLQRPKTQFLSPPPSNRLASDSADQNPNLTTKPNHDASHFPNRYAYLQPNGSLTQKLSPGGINIILRNLQSNAGLNIEQPLSGHSFRVGKALDLLESGESLPTIMLRGGWKTESTVIRYLRAWELD